MSFDNNYNPQKIGLVTKIILATKLASTPAQAQKMMIPIAGVFFVLAIFFFYQVFSSPTPPPAPPLLEETEL